jgi:ornithine carbamoyltransferase
MVTQLDTWNPQLVTPREASPAMTNHLIDLHDLGGDTIRHLLSEAARLKALTARREFPPLLGHRVVALVFEKPSLRTRVSFETAVAHLGGTSLFLPGDEVGLGWRESVADFARTMAQYVDAMVLRVFKHETVVEVARHATCPVINGLSDAAHPCQALADLLTVQELFGELRGRTLVFVGDGNNVAKSLALSCGKVGVRFVLTAPPGYGFDEAFLAFYRRHTPGGELEQVGDPAQAVRDADVLYTDVWTSMGQEAERAERLERFAAYQINAALLAHAPKHAKLLHCLPAKRGEEITDEVMDGPRSAVFQQAGNRLHAQKAVLAWLLG